MALQIAINYRNYCLTYDVNIQEEGIYQLRLNEQPSADKSEYVPEKMVIRRKGKIWISDLEDYTELVNKLTAEILSFHFAA
jgi:hypothetical protein